MAVMSLGVIAAFLLAASFILYYGPSGRYLVYTALIEPDILQQFNYNDQNPETGGEDRYVFDQITFQKGKDSKIIDLTTYTDFYALIKNDRSLNSVSDTIKQDFQRGDLAVLKIFVRTESSAAWQKNRKLFQEVEIEPQGNYYRIQLHESDQGVHFVYFYHPEILSKALKVFSR